MLRVDNQALPWLKTNSIDQAMIGSRIAPLNQYHFKTIHARWTGIQMVLKGPTTTSTEKNCQDPTRSEQGIQFHVAERL